MSATDDSWTAELDDLVDGERYDSDVIGATTYETTWRGYKIVADVQYFGGDRWHLQTRAPSEPPAYAHDLLRDLRDGDEIDPWIAAVLADGWDINLDELEGER